MMIPFIPYETFLGFKVDNKITTQVRLNISIKTFMQSIYNENSFTIASEC